MATRKHSRSEDAVAPNTSMNPSDLTVASERVRKSAPIEKLLDILELCEQVLDYLSMNDILHAIQACRAFKTNVENSTRLQIKLFLAPDFTRRRNWNAVSSTHTLLSGAKAAQHIAAVEAAGGLGTGEVVFYTPHPVVQLHDRGDVKRQGLVSYACCRAIGRYSSGDGAVRAPVIASVNIWSKPTSLENMFLTQPPTRVVELSDGYFGFWFEKREVFVETGVTFGDVFRAMREVTREGESLPHRLSFKEGIVASARMRELAESVDELSIENDPTRWVLKDRRYVLKEGGFEFL